MDNKEKLEDIVNILTYNEEFIENLSEENIKELINYLEKEIERKELILNNLKNN